MSNFKLFTEWEQVDTYEEDISRWARANIVYDPDYKDLSGRWHVKNNCLVLECEGHYLFNDDVSKNFPFKSINADPDYDDINLKIRMSQLRSVKGLQGIIYNDLNLKCPFLEEFDEKVYADFMCITSASLTSLNNIAAGKLVLFNSVSLSSLKDINEEVTNLVLQDCLSLTTLKIGKKCKRLNKILIHLPKIKQELKNEIETFFSLETRDEKMKFDSSDICRFERDSSPMFFSWLESNEPYEEWIHNHRGLVASKKFGF